MNDSAMEFGCPICHASRQYSQADDLTRPDGSAYSFAIYKCLRCDFHFTDPAVYPIAAQQRSA